MSQALRQVDLAGATEVRTQLASRALETDEPGIDRAYIQARPVNSRTAIGKVAVIGVTSDLEVDLPPLLARFGVQRGYGAERSRDVEGAVGVDRRRFECRSVGARRECFSRVSCVVDPRNLEAPNVGRRNALGRRVR